MKRFISALLFIAVLGFIGYEVYQKMPKPLKQVDIPQHEFVKELKIVDSDNYTQEETAHLYKSDKNYWVRYCDQTGKVRDLILPNDGKSYDAVRFASEDSCRLIKLE